jgi:uncharacterized membrane protein YqjE
MALGDLFGGLWAQALQALRGRLELAALDLQEELVRAIALLAAAWAAALVLTLALAAAAATVVVWFWDSARIPALLGVTAVFVALGVTMCWRIARALAERPQFMAATLQELRKDCEAWRGLP